MLNIKLISFLDPAIREQLTKLDKIQYVQEGVDFNKIIYNVYKRYLSLIQDEEVVYEILLEAFTELFIRKAGDALKCFNGLYEGEEVSIEAYLKTLYTREVIRISKKNTEEFKKRQVVNPIEDESTSEAFDRVSMGSGVSKGVDNSEEIKYLTGIYQDYKDRYDGIIAGTIKVVNAKNSTKLLKKKMKKLKEQISNLKDDKQVKINKLTVKLNSVLNQLDELQEEYEFTKNRDLKPELIELQREVSNVQAEIDRVEKSKYKTVAPDDDINFTTEEDTIYSSYLNMISLEMKRQGKDELDFHIFNMLTDGFLQIEIAQYFDLPRNDISRRVKKLKTLVTDFATEQADWFENDSLLVSLNKMIEDGATTISPNVITKNTKDLYKQVYSMYGRELTY